MEFHYIDPDYKENNSGDVVSYTAPAYEFLNKNNEYQISQILKDGESLEQIVNPLNRTDASGNEVSFFYGWYTADMSSDTTAWNSAATASPYYSGTITYTWSNPLKVDDQTPISISASDTNSSGAINEGDTVTWTIGSTSGTSTLDAEGTAHVYLVPVYSDYYFVNFHMGNKESEDGLRNNLLMRRLVVFGQSDTTTIRIGDVEGPSPDPAHEIFAGWETANFDDATPETIHYYQTLDDNGDEIKKTIGLAENYEEAQNSTGYYITVAKTGSALSSIDLYPVFAEARWLYYNLGKSGNGAVYVPAAYKLTNDEGHGTYFDSLATTSRSGFTFGGWYANAAMVDNEIMNQSGDYDLVVSTTTDGVTTTTTTNYNQAIQLTDSTGAFVSNVKGKVFYSDTNDGANASKLYYAATMPTGDNYLKLFEITSDGKLYFYKDLDSLTVSALWTANTVNYKILFWEQNADDDDYTLASYKELDAIAGDVIKLSFSGNNDRTVAVDALHGTDSTITLQNTNSSNDYYVEDLDYLHIKEHGYDGWTSTTANNVTTWAETGVEINGDGSTLINVYYDRNIYTLWFYLGAFIPDGGSSGTSTYEQHAIEDISGTVYGLVNGSYVALNSYAGADGNTFYAYTDTTNGTAYGIVDGKYVPLTVSPSTGTTTKDIYKQTTTLTSGSEYLIVSSNSTGTAYALGHNETTVVADPVTVKNDSDGIGAVWIDADDVDATSKWTAGNGYTFKNGNYYLNGNNSTLQISTISSNWSWTNTNNRLYQKGNRNSYYLRYNNNAFSLSTTNNSVYLYVKDTTSVTTTVNTYSYNGATYDSTVYMLTPYTVGYYYEQTSVAVPTGTAYVGTSSNSFTYFATPSSAGNMANPWVSIPVGTENGVTTSIQTTTSGSYTVYHYERYNSVHIYCDFDLQQPDQELHRLYGYGNSRQHAGY